jgi:hypothetical protein
MKSQEIAYIILSFVLIATFIAIFFFTYVSSVEADIIKTQIDDVIANFVGTTDLVLTPDQKNQVGKIITENLTVPDMSQADSEAAKTNSDLVKKSLIIFGSLVGAGLLIVILMWYRYRFDILEIVKYSLIMLGVIALTELLFVTLVTKNYRLIDENYLSYLVITNLQKYADS